MEVGEIITAVYTAADGDPTTLVVLTGGEPMRQPIGMLINNLLFEGFSVQVETNGTLYQDDLPYDDITVVCSPKAGRISSHLENKIHALKYVINARAIAEDNYPTQVLSHGDGRVARPPVGFKGQIFMQPFDSGDLVENVKHTQATVGVCFATGNTYCHQLHKLLNLE
jgi:organic radical activating enzyme